MTEKTEKAPVKKGGRSAGSKSLTPKQRAEAVALWRAGKVTLEDLADKFKKRPETFSRLFKRLGVKKGESVVETAKEMEKAAAAEAVSETQLTMQRIRTVRDEHFKMANGLAKMAWAQIVRAHKADIPLAKIKEDLAALKIAGDLIGNARKELFEVLNVEKHDKNLDEDELPDLTVRELTNNEIEQLSAPDRRRRHGHRG
jgi:AraC-like DNA-binding protein